MTETLPAEDFLTVHPPNHWNESEDWLTELREQLLDPVAARTLLSLVRAFNSGESQREPVIVDSDGVVDGHSRVLALWITGGEVRFEVRS